MPTTSPTIIVAARSAERGRDALALGASLAGLLDARVLLVGVHLAPLGAGAGLSDVTVREELMHELEQLRAGAPAGVAVDTQVVGATSIVRGLHEVAEAVAALALVVGASHLGHATRVLRGDIARQAFHSAPCAVAIAPEGFAQRDAERREQRRVGVAFDATPESEDALRTAIGLARRVGGRLHLVSVLDRPYVYVSPPEIDADGRAHYLHDLHGEVRDRLAAARSAVPSDLPVTTELVEGSAVAELADATGDLDLLVMGSRGYGPVNRVLLGSVAAGVADRARCPVLVLPRGRGLTAPVVGDMAVATGG
jgi:nucleotide-binding universal stress UspA family protein